MTGYTGTKSNKRAGGLTNRATVVNGRTMFRAILNAIRVSGRNGFSGSELVSTSDPTTRIGSDTEWCKQQML